MKHLILLFTSFIAVSVAQGADHTCLTHPMAAPPEVIPDFAHVDEAPPHNRARMDQIIEWWQSTCPDFSQQNVPRSREDNLLCRIQGESEQKLVVGAHFDKVSVGKGVADNWSGIVLVDALMNAFKDSEPKLTLEFVAFAEEEEGLYGSKEYVEQLDGKVVAMLNLDTIGLGDLVMSGGSDETLVCQVEEIAHRLDIPIGTQFWRDITSDWERFADRDIPAVGLHSVTLRNMRRIHHRRDKPGNVSLTHMANAYRVATIFIQQYSETDPSK